MVDRNETLETGDHPLATVIMPAFNEGETIQRTVAELRANCPEYEILVVDDGSHDDTAELAKKAGARVIRNRINKGYGASLKRGIRKASGEIVVFMDADGQHDSTAIQELLDHLEKGDMVVGERSKDDMVKSRRTGKWILSVAADYIAGQHIPDINSGFRAFYREDGMNYFHILPNGFSITTTLTLAMLKDGRDVVFIPITVHPRGGGTSTVRFFQDGAKTLLLILRVIMLFNPLKIFAPLSAILFSLGGAYAVVTVVLDLNITDTSILLLLSGLGSLALGLLADQIANLRRGG